jgi:hypothetical protein
MNPTAKAILGVMVLVVLGVLAAAAIVHTLSCEGWC